MKFSVQNLFSVQGIIPATNKLPFEKMPYEILILQEYFVQFLTPKFPHVQYPFLSEFLPVKQWFGNLWNVPYKSFNAINIALPVCLLH